MKRLMKWLLGHLPRPLLQRLARALAPVAALWWHGSRYACPLCGRTFRRLLPYGYITPREGALCPACLSLERHRLLWLWLERESDLAASLPRMLHIAPEYSLMKRFLRMYRGAASDRYVRADLESPWADLHFDVQAIPLPDHAFDLLICNHVLEHVADDRQALREFFRVLRPGGWGVLLCPVDETRATTLEDPSVTDPRDRERLFGQADHLRLYGRDYADRLREAGFSVEVIAYADRFMAADRERYGLTDERLYIVRKA